MLFKTGVLKNFAKFTGKCMCHSLSFNKVVGLLFIKKETLAQVVFIKKTASIDKESYESCKAFLEMYLRPCQISMRKYFMAKYC